MIYIVSMILLISLIYWLLRPESFRKPTTQIDQKIPANLPAGRTIFLSTNSGALSQFEMFYRSNEKTDKPAIVLIHGIAGSADTTWYNTYSALKNYYVLAPDLRGHGLTMQPSGPISIPQMADDIYKLMVKLGISSAHIIGHSLGGAVAMQLTYTHPEIVRKLVLIDTAAAFASNSFIRLGMSLYPYIVRMRNRLVGWQYENRERARAFTQYEVDPHYKEWVYQKRMFNQTESFIASWRGLLGFTAEPFLGSIKQSVLIVCGEYDDLVNLKARNALHTLLPQAEFVTIKGARHYPQIQYADEVNPLLIKFLDEAVIVEDKI